MISFYVRWKIVLVDLYVFYYAGFLALEMLIILFCNNFSNFGMI